MNPEFWRGRRVFLTGHTGFKGGWLSLWLQSLGARVTGFALQPPTRPSLFDEARVGVGMDSIIGDVRDRESLFEAIRGARPEIVIHLAAQSIVRESYRHPVETFATNVMGTVHVLEAVRSVGGVRAVVNVTSDKCYENPESDVPHRETDPMGGFDPYSSSKACAELVSAAYRASFLGFRDAHSHGVLLATARAGNVLGGGDWAQDRLIPDVVAAFERGEPVRIRNPQAIRPWQHVLEPLRGYLMLAERLWLDGVDFAESWNFGPVTDDTRPVAWVVENLVRLWGPGASWVVDGGVHPHEATCLRLDISKACSRLAWKPVIGLGRTIEMVVDWARARGRGDDMREFTIAQIGAYQSLATSG